MDQRKTVTGHTTTLLLKWREGDREAGDQLIKTVYSELRRLAAWYMRQERAEHTLQATALVNELYVRLIASEPINWQNRAHFFAVAAQQLRRILVNHARDRQAARRGGRQVRVSLTDLNALGQPSEFGEAPDLDRLLLVDESLRSLEKIDPRAAAVVELRFFGGLKESEIAEAVGISAATVKRDWDFARAWLIRHLGTPPSE